MGGPGARARMRRRNLELGELPAEAAAVDPGILVVVRLELGVRQLVPGCFLAVVVLHGPHLHSVQGADDVADTVSPSDQRQ
jgi:hypothetical protein